MPGTRAMIPRISVLMPVFNAERFVAEAVESILRQTFTDFEFLIIDDGSTDGSLRILERLASRDDRVRLVSRSHRGLVPALNELMNLARGEFVARMDADDIALPDRFDLQVAHLEHNPDVVCLGGGHQLIDCRGRILRNIHHPGDDATLQELALEGRCPITHSSLMMRRQAVVAVGGYREEMREAEDLDLLLRLGEHGHIQNIDKILVQYRKHDAAKSWVNLESIPQYFKIASDQACDRRGLERRYRLVPLSRPVESRRHRHDSSLTFGWWGFELGNRATALHYALQTIRWVPWRFDGWRLLACVVLKLPWRRNDGWRVLACAVLRMRVQ